MKLPNHWGEIKEISNCCMADVITRSGDEGTGHYECSNCGQACDLWSKTGLKRSKPIQKKSNMGKSMVKKLTPKDMIALAKREIAEWTKFLKEYETRN